MFCTHCDRHGHDIWVCRAVLRAYDLPVPIGIECSSCGARGSHYSSYCPGGPFCPPLSRWPRDPCSFCKEQGFDRRGHEVPTCWNFARRHGLSAPYWWKCGICGALGDHSVNSCPTVEAYVSGRRGTLVVFDLETTGLRDDAEILEIAASTFDEDDEMFHAYAFPRGGISTGASSVNGFRMYDGELRRHGRRVQASSASRVLDQFINWIENFGGDSPILVAHNCRGFDARVLLYNLAYRSNPRVQSRFIDLDVQFADTLPLCASALRNYGSVDYVNGLNGVHLKIYGREVDNLHHAKSDVNALMNILNSKKLQTADFERHVFSAESLANQMRLPLF